MTSRLGLYALVAALVGTAGFALLERSGSPAREPLEPSAVNDTKTSSIDVDQAPLAMALPPGHPHIDKTSSPSGAPIPVNTEAATIGWKVPLGWETKANPSSMRIATYRIPHVSSDTEDAEMSVARAGGSTEANIQRWLGQFDDAGKEERSEKTVNGLHVAIVGVNGTWLGSGMTPGAASTPRPKWALLGAIVDASGSPYFFKLIGPAATVRAARPQFDALIASLANK